MVIVPFQTGVWRSLAARFVRDEEVVGSNPATPTEKYQVRGLIRSAGRAPEWFLEIAWGNLGEDLDRPLPGAAPVPQDEWRSSVLGPARSRIQGS